MSFVANARNGTWARVTGWDVRCSTVSDDVLYFGNNSGMVFKADTGGLDGTDQFKGTYVAKFSNSQVWRSGNSVRLTYRANAELDITLSIHSDYQIDPMTAPAASYVDPGEVWGTWVWGTDVWGGTAVKSTYTQWQAAYDNGYALAPALEITSNQTQKLVFEILSTQVNYETGSIL